MQNGVMNQQNGETIRGRKPAGRNQAVQRALKVLADRRKPQMVNICRCQSSCQNDWEVHAIGP